MDWSADERVLAETVELFRCASSPDNAVQLRVHSGLATLKARDDGCCYLTHVFARAQNESVQTRQMAGLVLKNSVVPPVQAVSPSRAAATGALAGPDSADNAISPAVLHQVKKMVLPMLCSEHEALRSTAGSVVTTIITKWGCASWPEALQALGKYVCEAQSVPVALSSLETFKKIAQDELEPQIWEIDEGAPDSRQLSQFIQFSLDTFLPLLTTLFATPGVHPDLYLEALNILEVYNDRHAFAPGEFANKYFDWFWRLLGEAGGRPDSKTRLVVLKAMCTVLEYNSDAVICYAEIILKLVLEGCTDPSDDVRLVALGFWPEFLKESSSRPLISNILTTLVPILVDQCVYTSMDYAQLDPSQLEDDNANVPDAQQELQPRFYQGQHGGRSEGEGEDGDDDEDDAGAASAWGNVWTVRKAAALALDSTAVVFPQETLPICLPLIEVRLQSTTSWELQESGVLALGAITKGCLVHLDQYVPNVLQLLIKLSAERKPLLRSISCWCLNRFAPWFCKDEYAGTFLSPVIDALLLRIVDRNKCVQEAATSAFAGLEEQAKYLLVPELPKIFQVFAKALATHQTKNLSILYDAIGTLAHNVGPSFIRAHPMAHTQLVLEPLLGKWQLIKPGEYTTAPLLECVSAIVQAIGEDAAPMAPLLVEKTISICKGSLETLNDVDNVKVDNDVIECCLDLVSYLADALQANLLPILARHDIMPVLSACCMEPKLVSYMGIKQSAFALVGDLTTHCGDILRPSLPQLVQTLTAHLTSPVWPVASNSSWAVGQLVERFGAEGLQAHVKYVCQQLQTIMMADFSNTALRQNACITFGRCAMACPYEIAPLLPDVLGVWCDIMAKYQGENEKVKSFRGLVKALVLSPQAAVLHREPLNRCIESFYYAENYPPFTGRAGEPQAHPEIAEILPELNQWLSKLPAAS